MSDTDPRAGVGLPAPAATVEARTGDPGVDDRGATSGTDPRPSSGQNTPTAPDADDRESDGRESDGHTGEGHAGEGRDDDGRAGDGRRRHGRSALWWTPLVLVVVAALLAAGAAIGGLIDRSPGENSVDVGFARDMSEHHSQAVQMAMIEFSRGADATSRSVAQDIALTQQREIGVMSTWLSGWGRTQSNTGAAMRWMGATSTDGSSTHGMAGMNGSGSGSADDSARMPGMATPAQLRQLATLRGRDLDVLFLTLMIHHHRGGLAMAQYASRHGEQDRTRGVARAMVLNQSVEIDQMQQDLVRLGAPRA
ncbi:DUF305 domain-containing protein [Candidatus Frankia nodulisporulans]|uniref:DUF305 domain-containing protein n=1 Tax=Candidatus Frankia nodulisporulans TaxID=2060052 RepID=UPI0013D0B0DC|nr:DUF305 domain-containing protein [Candidatus Frankia nodulisporulans]